MWLIRNLKTSTNYTVSIFYLSDKSTINEMSKSGQLLAPTCTQYDLKDYKTALSNSMTPYISTK